MLFVCDRQLTVSCSRWFIWRGRLRGQLRGRPTPRVWPHGPIIRHHCPKSGAPHRRPAGRDRMPHLAVFAVAGDFNMLLLDQVLLGVGGGRGGWSMRGVTPPMAGQSRCRCWREGGACGRQPWRVSLRQRPKSLETLWPTLWRLPYFDRVSGVLRVSSECFSY